MSAEGGPWKTAASWLLFLLAVLLVARFGGSLLDLFRLDAGDTIYDYQTADSDDRVEFLMRACNRGECLPRVDWSCGFSLEPDDRVYDCISMVVDTAKPWVRLDTVRKLCGQRFAVFTGALHGDPQQCEELGGTWGVKMFGTDVDF
jgi:hypothetical protein